jgi:CheY-like chemotaxis protein
MSTTTFNVLLVDDNRDDIEIITARLGNSFEEIALTSAQSVSDALEIIQHEAVDCILADYQMPGEDCLDLFDQLRSEGIVIPFLFITGYADRTLYDEFKRRRINEWLE